MATLKKCPYKRIPAQRDDGSQHPIYALKDEIVANNHPDLATLDIIIMFRYGWKPDSTGRLVLGQARKASDIERELHPVDAYVVLNWDFWNESSTTDAQRQALLDHELCHITVAKDDNEDVVNDERGRPNVKMRHHDIEEFTDIISRHGNWCSGLRETFTAMMSHQRAQDGGEPIASAETSDESEEVTS